MFHKITLCLIAVCCFLTNKKSQAQSCYAISDISQTVAEPSSSTALNTLSVCHQYQFVYMMRNGSAATVNDNVTINLPDGIAYASLSMFSGAASVLYASGTNSPVFTITGWAPDAVLSFTILANTPSCGPVATTNSVTTIKGVNSCSQYSVSASLPVLPPTLSAVNNAGIGSLLANVGDVNELVFKVQNVSSNGATIPQIDVACSPDPTISFLGQYYVSTSGTPVSGNHYTYNYPSGPGISSPATITGSSVHLGAADFNYFFSSNELSPLQTLYIHIPYQVDHCDNPNPGGIYNFSWGCGLTACNSITVTSSIDVKLGNPKMQVTSHLPFNTATYCTTNAQPTSGELGFAYKNIGLPVAGAPAGSARATDLKFFIYNTTDFGSLDMSTLKITSGAYTLPVPSSVILASTYNAFTTYTIDLSLLPVTTPTTIPGVWAPLGANSIADLDGDGFLDDIDELGTFTISAQYSYNTASCPTFSTCSYYGTPATIMTRYNDQCHSLLITDPRQIPMTTGDPFDAQYSYAGSGGGATIVVPPDVVEGIDFSMSVCNNLFREEFIPTNYDLGCPNGYHEQYIALPAGYHFNPGSLTMLSSGITGISGNVYQLPSLTASATAYCGGGATQLITPTIQEICEQPSVPAHILVKFGRLQSGSCGGYSNRTFTLPCYDIPMYLECTGGATVCPTIPLNFGADQLSSRFRYVCDESCTECAPTIACANTTAYHHCNGDCDFYFSTNQNFKFERKNLGSSNPDPYYTCASAQTPLAVTTEPSIDVHSAYPGDVIEASVSGLFNGILHTTGTPTLTGANFDDVYMQVRFNNITAGLSASPDLFRLDPSQGSIKITNQSTLLSVTIPASALTYSYSNTMGVSHMNINIDAVGRAFMSDPAVTYSLVADVFLIARNTPSANSSVPMFYYEDYYPLVDLRTEFMATQTLATPTATTELHHGSCDSWGDHFTMLQPRAVADKYYHSGPVSTCDTYTMGFSFGTYGGRYYQGMDDFPNEFRNYAVLDPDVDIRIPPGYQYISSSFLMTASSYSPAGVNAFGTFTSQTIPITGETVTSSSSGTILHYHGIDGSSCWPLLDLKYNSVFPICYINVVMQPMCDAPADDHFEYASGYTIGTNRYDPLDPLLQLHTAFSFTDIPVHHVNPQMTLFPPTASVNAYSNLVTFDFKYCGPVSLSAEHPWMAFENALTNSLDLTTATVTALSSGASVPYTGYTDVNGNQAILANVTTFTPSLCRDYRISAYVNSNGCVPGHTTQIDNMVVKYGNECSAVSITSPDLACIQGTLNFPFQRYPSDLQLVVPSGGLPTNAVDLCNGIQTYTMIISSADIGTVRNPTFWIHLPAGISVQNIQFDYTAGSPATYATSSPDGMTYGSGSDPGWNIYSHLPGLANGLPGGTTNNQVVVTATLQTACGYNGTDYVIFNAGGISSCSLPLVASPPVQHRPALTNSIPADELVIQAALTTSDMSPGLNCSNTGIVTVTVTNNGGSSNLHDELLSVTVPGSPLAVSNYAPATLNTNTLTWTIPAGSIAGSGASQTFTFNISLGNTMYCQQSLPITAGISYSETINCTSEGGTCALSYSAAPVSFTISACCNPCSLSVNLTPQHVSCYGLQDGSATSTPLNGTPSYAYLWSNGQAGSTLTGVGAGTYTLNLTDANGCIATQTVLITEPSPFSISAGPVTSTLCVGSSTILCATVAETYTWSTGETGSCITVSPFATSIYTVTGTNANGCTATATTMVIVNPVPVISVSPVASALCIGSATTICASGATSYTWGTGQISSCITVTPSATTVYTVTGSTDCLSAPVNVTVTVVPLPTLCIIPSATICAGECTKLSGQCPFGDTPPGMTYSWSPASGLTISTALSIPACPTVTTVYTLTATNANGCVSTGTTMVTVNPVPAVSVTPVSSTVCVGSSTTLCASGAASYTWSTGQTSACMTVTPSATTLYTVTGTNSGGCLSTAVATVVVKPVPTVSVTPVSSTICVGSSTTICASGATSYTWSTGQTSACITVTPSANTIYTVTGSNGICTGSASATVIVRPKPVVCISPTVTICRGACTTLTAACSPAKLSYTWSPAPGIATATLSSITVCPPVTTVYTLTAGNASGCITTATTAVYVTPIPTLAVSPSTYTMCAGTSHTLCPSGATTYTWNSPTSYTWTSASHSCIAVSPPAGVHVYTVTGSTGACNSAPLTATVYVRPAPVVCASPNVTICPRGCTTLTVGCATTKTSYTWSPAPTIGSPTLSAVVVCPTVSTVYTLTASNAFGCITTATTGVYVTPTPTVTISSVPAPTICAGTPVTLCASGAGSYLWNTLPVTTSTCITVSPMATTVYTVRGRNGNCNPVSATYTVTVRPKPVLCAQHGITICRSATTTVSGACSGGGGAAANTVYSWMPVTGLSSPSSITSVASPAASTVYTLVATNTLTGCSSSVTAVVNVVPTPTVTISSLTPTICSGSSATLCASGAATYTWNTIPVSTNTCVTVSPTVTTIYTVTGTSGTCRSTASTTVFVVPSNLSISGPVLVKCGTPHTYSMIPVITSPPTLYTWSASNSTALPLNFGSTAGITFNAFGGVITWTATTVISPGQVCRTVRTLPVVCLPLIGLPNLRSAGSGMSAGIYPNPNNGNMVLEYRIGSNGVLEIMDYNNRVVASYNLSADNERLEITNIDLADGVYMYKVTVNQEIIKADKIIIIR